MEVTHQQQQQTSNTSITTIITSTINHQQYILQQQHQQPQLNDHLTNIPIELILHIISYCQPFDIINSISRVSRLLYKCSRNNLLWKIIVLNDLIPFEFNRLPTPNYSHFITNSNNTTAKSTIYTSSSSKSPSIFNTNETNPTLKQWFYHRHHINNSYDIDWLAYFAESTSLKQTDSIIWSTRKPLPETYLLDRYRHTSSSFTCDKGQTKFMVIGGSDSELTTFKSDIIIVDPLEMPIKILKPTIKKEIGENCFITLGEMDIGISRHTADYIPGVGVFVFGGSRVLLKDSCVFLSLPCHSVKSNSMDLMCYRNNGSESNGKVDDGCIYWKPLTTFGTPPPPRSDHTSTCIGRDIYIFGGSDENINPLNDLYVFHIDSLTWQKIECLSNPSPRSGHSMISVNNMIYVYGGGVWDRKKRWVNRNSQLFKLDLKELYDQKQSMNNNHSGSSSLTLRLRWEEIQCYRPPSMSTFSSMFSIGHHIFLLFGGCFNNQLTDSQYYFDTITNIWHPLKGINNPLSSKNSSGVCIIDNKIYFIGGSRKTMNVDILEMAWIKKLKNYSDIKIKA